MKYSMLIDSVLLLCLFKLFMRYYLCLSQDLLLFIYQLRLIYSIY